MNEQPHDLQHLDFSRIAHETELRITINGPRGQVTFYPDGAIGEGGGSMDGFFDGVSIDSPSIEETLSQACTVETGSPTGLKSVFPSSEFAELAPLIPEARRYVFADPTMIGGSPSIKFDLAPVPRGTLSTSTSTGITVGGKEYTTTWARTAILGETKAQALIATVVDIHPAKKLNLYLLSLA